MQCQSQSICPLNPSLAALGLCYPSTICTCHLGTSVTYLRILLKLMDRVCCDACRAGDERWRPSAVRGVLQPISVIIIRPWPWPSACAERYKPDDYASDHSEASQPERHYDQHGSSYWHSSRAVSALNLQSDHVSWLSTTAAYRPYDDNNNILAIVSSSGVAKGGPGGKPPNPLDKT